MGRELATDSVMTRVRLSPLTLMFARSGVGKSSFLNCRLVPQLSNESAVLYANEWGGEEPVDQIDRLISDLSNSSQSRSPENSVLVLDQFEDVFKVAAHRDRLWDRLAEMVNVPDRSVHFLISMREEWLGAWQEVNEYLPAANNSLVRLAPLTDREIQRAIKRPASIEGSLTFSDTLALRLMNDLHRPSAYGLGGTLIEPGLLQLVCRRLWNEAQLRNSSVVEESLYLELGSADQIIREFVWNELGSAGESTLLIKDPASPNRRPILSANDRVLWAGITRYLTAAHGVKSIVSPASLAKQLTIGDLGLAGHAVAVYELDNYSLRFLEQIPEKRTDPPILLTNWITSVLDKACHIGFMKRHKQNELYELAHDSLADIFQVFKIEFESWLRAKYYKFIGALVGGVIVLPILVTMIWSLGLWATLGEVGVFVLGSIVVGMAWVAIGYVFGMIAYFLYKAFVSPVIRWFCKGRIAMPKPKDPPAI